MNDGNVYYLLIIEFTQPIKKTITISIELALCCGLTLSDLDGYANTSASQHIKAEKEKFGTTRPLTYNARLFRQIPCSA